MAASKKKKTETKKTGTKKEKKIALTFSPILGAAAQFTALLREKKVKDVYGEEIASYEPSIEGLPMKLTVQKGEVIEVTPAQFEALQKMGHAETDDEYKERQAFIDKLNNQHPEKLTWEMIVAEGSNFSTLYESQMIIYNDKLVRV